MEATATHATTRYLAHHNLDHVIRSQGRTKQWIADQIGISRSHFSHVVARRRTIGDAEAEQVARTLNVPLFLLFELAEASILLADTERHEEAVA